MLNHPPSFQLILANGARAIPRAGLIVVSMKGL